MAKEEKDMFGKTDEPDDEPDKVDLMPVKTIRIAVSGDVQVTETERQIIDTPAFQRLRRIKQLGTSYLVYPSAVHTRYEHSLGTLKMADIMVDKVNQAATIQKSKGVITAVKIDNEDRIIIRLAALLHDTTHIPFGHTLEDECCLFVGHDSSEKRFKHFFGEKSDIGSILIERIGQPNYELLLKILKTKRKETYILGKKAFISDIVKNTVCADLLDYLQRDVNACNLDLGFGKRFLDYLFLTNRTETHNKKKVETVRLTIRVWKEKEKRHRRDLIDELLNLLNCRFFLGAAVYYHHAKMITAAMVSRAVQQAIDDHVLTEKELWDLGDDELLYKLANNKKSELAKTLANSILKRSLYDDFFVRTRLEVEAKEINLLNTLEENYHLNKRYRLNEENSLTANCRMEDGSVLIYCPDPEMSIKEAQMLVLWKGQAIPLQNINDPLLSKKIKNILESHKQLWSMKVFVKSIENIRNHSLLTSFCETITSAGDDYKVCRANTVELLTLDILSDRQPEYQGLRGQIQSKIAALQRSRGLDPSLRQEIEEVVEEAVKAAQKTSEEKHDNKETKENERTKNPKNKEVNDSNGGS